MEYKQETVPCKICGIPTTYAGDQLCDNCWEVNKRLDLFLESKKARELVIFKLKKFHDNLVSSEEK